MNSLFKDPGDSQFSADGLLGITVCALVFPMTEVKPGFNNFEHCCPHLLIQIFSLTTIPVIYCNYCHGVMWCYVVKRSAANWARNDSFVPNNMLNVLVFVLLTPHNTPLTNGGPATTWHRLYDCLVSTAYPAKLICNGSSLWTLKISDT